ncbi:MAG: hypothetical protein E7585_06685 [Ruminococcaceae bacterium]|nr:hypothetical protein [Oscillospiraceae bacterium]
MPRKAEACEQKKLFGGALILMPATVFSKIVGLFYKIPLIAIVGVEGMAYFLAAYHVYSLLFVLSATGLPTALSLQVARSVAAGKPGAVGRVFAVALCLFLTLGLGGTALLFFCAPTLAARLAMADAAASLYAIAPALLLAAFIGAAKGYFQGLGHMLPTALSEVLEAMGKLLFGLLFALWAKKQGMPVPIVAAYAIFGITAGLALAALLLTVLLLIYRIRQGRLAKGALPRRRAVLAQLLRVAVPVTLSASVMSLVTLIDTALISGRLQKAGFAPAVAHAMYSSYGNLAVPLYNLIPSLLTPLTLAMMPLLSAALTRGEREEGKAVLASALRVTALFSVPAALGLGVFSEPILQLIYGGQQEAIALSTPLLTLLALSVLPAALITLTGSALQAAGRTATPVVAMLCGALMKLGVEYLLLPLPQLHIYAAPISTLACNITVLIIQAIVLARALPFGFFSGKELFCTLLGAVLSVGGGGALYFGLRGAGLQSRWLMLPVLALVVSLFLLLALLLGAVRREDLAALPAGERLARFLQKHKLIK